MEDTPDRSTRRTSTQESATQRPRTGASTATSADDPELSVVVVTYNEADRVAACLESILECCRDRPATEVILVDSNSTDETVEIACEYPVTVLQIPDDELTTPGAGRYVGTEAASGDQILFVDGDIELTEGWLDDAMALVREHDDVAGVDGHLNGSDADEVEAVRMLHGVVLYDAAALDAAGGFDPHLLALEDSELSARLRDAGYRLLRLPEVVGRHPVSTGTGEVVRRWRNGYYFGLGQVFRKALASGRIVDAFVPRNPYPLVFNAWFLAGAVAALVGRTPFVAWLVLSAVLFTADVAWEGWSRAVQRSTAYAIVPLGLFRGAMMRRRKPAAYPLETTVTVQRADRDAQAATPAEP